MNTHIIRISTLVCCLLPGAVQAEELVEEAGVPIFEMVQAGGLVGYTIILVSIVCMTLALQLFLRLRSEQEALNEINEKYRGQFNGGDEQQMLQWSGEKPFLIAHTLRAGINAQAEHKENAIQEEAAHYSGELFRRADYLLFIGNTAPMLGLLGTVFGMMTSFNVLATQGGVSDPGELAGGISGALVTTCMGLIVALPALIFYTMLRNRIEVLIADVGRSIEHLLFPERKRKEVETEAIVAKAPPVKVVPAPVKKVYMPEAKAQAES